MKGATLAILLLSATALADARLRGHMDPFPDELLPAPVRLQCGLIIQEWRPPRTDPATVARLDHICTRAMTAFFPFLAAHGMKPETAAPFTFDASLLPDGSCYRCLNDVEFRFYARPMHNEVLGYTSVNHLHLYMVGDPDVPEFEGTMTHEIYHAAEIHYGVFRAHDPSDDAERAAVSEHYVRMFTRSLGL